MLTEYPILKKITSTYDLKKLSLKEQKELAKELRAYIIKVISINGGHLASNLGTVELSISLHSVFHSPKDKIIWDVGHQCYAHKILTGRKKDFPTIRKKDGLSGFPKRSESKHDIFETGHSSTAISAATGILCGQKLQDIPGKVIAVVGDGALTGGEALEGLNFAGQLDKDLVIVLNDNKMSISRNVGAMSFYFSKITSTRLYQVFQKTFDAFVLKIPYIGKGLLAIIYRLKKSLKAFLFRDSLFSDLGYEYIGPVNGHNIEQLKHIFHNVKSINKPVVVHVLTTKGKGYSHAEDNPSLYHGVGGFSILDGKLEKKEGLTFTDCFSQSLVELAKNDERIVAITAAMASGTGLNAFQALFPHRFYDVGITEQHAVTFSAGLAVSGLLPVLAVYSTFIQRAVDQVIHDVALPNLPVVMALDRAGIVGDDGETHHGVFDIALFKSVPNLILMAPGSPSEMKMMLQFALEHPGPVILRYPKAACVREYEELQKPLIPGRGVFVRNNKGDVLIVTLGSLLEEAVEASNLLNIEGILTDVYNLRFIKPLDLKHLNNTLSLYSVVIILEDGVKQGGIGQDIITGCSLHRQVGTAGKKYIHLALPDKFIPHATRHEILEEYRLDSKRIADRVLKIFKRPDDESERGILKFVK
jgi:1-deoxy-D-xylulose-5-phosphate synthase